METIRFGENGWRAKLDEGFDKRAVRRIARALGLVWKQRNAGARVLVGYDTRRHARAYARVAAETLAGQGFEVILSDRVCPTPVIGWAVARDPDCVGGVILTASEKSHEYGGLLVRLSDGGPMSRDFAQLVDGLIGLAPDEGRRAVEQADLVGPYLDAVVERVDAQAISSCAPRIVADPMYGAGQSCLIAVLERLGCDVVPIHDGEVRDFRGLHPDPVEPWVDECERVVRGTGAAMGLVLDGDGDRVAAIDEQGTFVSRHDLAPLLLEHLVLGRHEAGRVVSTSATSLRLERQARRLGLEHTRVPVGFIRVHDELIERDVVFAADEHGGMCLPDHLFERDGIVHAALVVEMLALGGERVSTRIRQQRAAIGEFEYATRDIRLEAARIQVLRNILPGINAPRIRGMWPVEVSHADGLRAQYEDGSWMLLRPAKTQPVVRAYAETPSSADVWELLAETAKLVV